MWRERLYRVWVESLLQKAGPGFGRTLLLAALFTMVLAWFAASNTFDYDLKDMMSGQDEAFRQFQECQEIFGPDDDIVVALPMNGLTPDALGVALKARNSLEGIAGVESCYDLARAAGVTDAEKLSWLLERPRLLDRRLDEIRASQVLRGFLLGKEEKAQALILRTVPLGNREKQALVRDIRARLVRDLGAEAFHLGGYQVFAERYVHHTLQGNALFGPLSVAAALAVSLVLLRSVLLTLAVAVTIILPVIWTHGLFAVLGYHVSLFSTLLTPIVLFVGLSLSVQLIARFNLASGKTHLPVAENGSTAGLRAENAVGDILAGTLREALPPGFLCTLTALVGFSSQMFSNMAGVRAFGIFSTLGSGMAFISVFYILPGLLSRLPPVPGKRRSLASDQAHGRAAGAGSAEEKMFVGRSPTPERKLGRLLARCLLPPSLMYAGAVLITAVVGWGIAFLHVGSDPLEVFPADDPVLISQRFIDSHFNLGARQVSLMLKSGSQGFDTLETFQRLNEAGARIASFPEVQGVFSPCLLVTDALGGLSGGVTTQPRTDAQVVRGLRLARSSSGSLTAAFLNHPFYSRGRLVVGLRRSDAPAVVRVAEQAQRVCNEVASGNFVATATGRMYLSAVIENQALLTEISAFATALAGILLIIGVGFGTLRALFIAFVANFLPLVMALGTMGWLGKPLDPVGAMVPCLCLGIIVDDTIHLFHEMASEERKGHGPWRSRAVLMLRLGWAIVSASLIPIVGLGILCFSSFGPIRSFGTYAVLAMSYGIFFDLFLTPALLALTRPLTHAPH